MIVIEVDPRQQFARQLESIAMRQLPYAAMQALNSTAWNVRKVWEAKISQVFDRPVPLTQRAVVYEKATRDNLTATIKVRDEARGGTPPAKYLLAEVQGGARRLQRFERRLQHEGHLPAGMITVPGMGARRNKYGNISRAQVRQMLDGLNMHGPRMKPGRRKKGEPKRKGASGRGLYFSIHRQRGNGLKPGIYQRVGSGKNSGVRSILRFVQRADYDAVYHIHDYTAAEFRANFPQAFALAFERAVSSAKGQA